MCRLELENLEDSNDFLSGKQHEVLFLDLSLNIKLSAQYLIIACQSQNYQFMQIWKSFSADFI